LTGLSSTTSVRFVILMAVPGRLLCLTTMFDYFSKRNSFLQWFLFCAYTSCSLAISARNVNSNSETLRGLEASTRTASFCFKFTTVRCDASSSNLAELYCVHFWFCSP
jgi:hypothetical protein